MTAPGWDAGGQAASVLRTIAADYGEASLSDASRMSSLLKDLLPDSPRETSVLVAAADADVAQILRDRLNQGVSPTAAAVQAATVLADRTGLSAQACQWATAAIGAALTGPAGTMLAGTAPTSSPQPAQPSPGPPPTQAWQPPQPTQPLQPTHPQQPQQQQWQPTAGWQPQQPAQAWQGQQPAQAWQGPQLYPGWQAQPAAPAGSASRGAAIFVATCSMLGAVLMPAIVLIVPFPLPAPFASQLTILGLLLTTIAALSFGPSTRTAALGLALGAGPLTAAVFFSFSEIGSTFARHGLLQVTQVVGTLAVLAGAVAAAIALGRQLGFAGKWLKLMPALFAGALIAYDLCTILPQLQWRFGSTGKWLPEFNTLGTGVHGWTLADGVMFVLLVPVPAILAAFLRGGSGGRSGVVVGLLIACLSEQIWVSWEDVQHVQGLATRAQPGLYATWAFWAIGLVIGVVLVVQQRSRSAAASQLAAA